MSFRARSGAAIVAPPYFFNAAARPVAIAASQWASLEKSARAIFLAPLNTWAAKSIECSRKSAGS